MLRKIFVILLVIAIVAAVAAPFALAAEATVPVQFYDYGGISLFDIDEIWDKEKYPYCVIQSNSNSTTGIYFFDNVIYYDSSTAKLVTDADVVTNFCQYLIASDPSSMLLWGEFKRTYYFERCVEYRAFNITSIPNPNNTVEPCWSNFDIKYLDGSQVFCAASERSLGEVIEYNAKYTSFAPVYDYGGVLLPDINSISAFDISEYPYSAIRYVSENTMLGVSVYFFDKPIDITVVGNKWQFHVTEDTNYLRFSGCYNSILNGVYNYDYRIYAKTLAAGKYIDLSDLHWANHDIVSNGETIYKTVAPKLCDPNSSGDVNIMNEADAVVTTSTNLVSQFVDVVTGTPVLLAFVIVLFVCYGVRLISKFRSK